MKRWVLPFLLSFATSIGALAQNPAFVTDSLDSYIARGMKDWNIGHRYCKKRQSGADEGLWRKRSGQTGRR